VVKDEPEARLYGWVPLPDSINIELDMALNQAPRGLTRGLTPHHKRTKHIERRHFFIRELIEALKIWAQQRLSGESNQLAGDSQHIARGRARQTFVFAVAF